MGITKNQKNGSCLRTETGCVSHVSPLLCPNHRHLRELIRLKGVYVATSWVEMGQIFTLQWLIAFRPQDVRREIHPGLGSPQRFSIPADPL